MTPEDRERERMVEVQTRLGMMCGSGVPTREQREIAARIADEHIEAIEMQEWRDKQEEAK